MPSDQDKAPLANWMNSDLLQRICRRIHFAPGAVLRQSGHYYRSLYLVIEGRVAVVLENGGARRRLDVGAGAPIGEISFLRGSPAVATVTAVEPTEAFIIDDPTLARLEENEPSATADLLRQLADIAEDRTSFNLVFAPPKVLRSPRPIEICLCRSREMLESAQRLRYAVYCEELGRRSPHADHHRKIIADSLDETGHVFVAVRAGEIIGTLRANVASDGPLGVLEDLYGMRRSVHHPLATAICTKFIVKKSARGAGVSLKLISALARSAIQYQIKECYIDCVPALLPYYEAIGFRVAGEKFFHPENGPSLPMVLDIENHGPRLTRVDSPLRHLELFIRFKISKLRVRQSNDR